MGGVRGGSSEDATSWFVLVPVGLSEALLIVRDGIGWSALLSKAAGPTRLSSPEFIDELDA